MQQTRRPPPVPPHHLLLLPYPFSSDDRQVRRRRHLPLEYPVSLPPTSPNPSSPDMGVPNLSSKFRSSCTPPQFSQLLHPSPFLCLSFCPSRSVSDALLARCHPCRVVATTAASTTSSPSMNRGSRNLFKRARSPYLRLSGGRTPCGHAHCPPAITRPHGGHTPCRRSRSRAAPDPQERNATMSTNMWTVRRALL